MDQFHITSLGLIVFLVGFIAESTAFLLYRRAKIRLKRLNGTGRITDIEIAHYAQLFFRAALVAVPVLLYLLASRIVES